MKRIDFIRKFAENASLSQKDAKEVAAAMGKTILECMDDEGVRPFDGFTFATKYRPAREGRNPKTGEKMTIAARKVPSVKFGKIAKEAFA